MILKLLKGNRKILGEIIIMWGFLSRLAILVTAVAIWAGRIEGSIQQSDIGILQIATNNVTTDNTKSLIVIDNRFHFLYGHVKENLIVGRRTLLIYDKLDRVVRICQ